MRCRGISDVIPSVVEGSGAAGGTPHAPPIRQIPRLTLGMTLLLLLACGGREPAPPPVAQKPPSPELPKPTDAAPAKPPEIAPIARDLDAIAAGGTLRVLFTFNSSGYFL